MALTRTALLLAAFSIPLAACAQESTPPEPIAVTPPAEEQPLQDYTLEEPVLNEAPADQNRIDEARDILDGGESPVSPDGLELDTTPPEEPVSPDESVLETIDRVLEEEAPETPEASE